MSNSHWYHFFYDDFGVRRSKINFFSGGKVCLVVASGGHMPLLPPLGSGTVHTVNNAKQRGMLLKNKCIYMKRSKSNFLRRNKKITLLLKMLLTLKVLKYI